MKNLFVIFIFISISCCAERETINTNFINDLASTDNRIAGQLFEDVYNGNLDTLTYESYINYLKSNEAPAAKGVVEIIQKAKDHYFKSKKYGFLIILYFADEHEIVCDNSGTSFIDSVHIYKPNELIPSLKEFSDKIKF
jgi:hypothetical protein